MHSVWVPLAHNVPTIQTTSPQCIIHTRSVWGQEVPTNHCCGYSRPHILLFTCIRCGYLLPATYPQSKQRPHNVLFTHIRRGGTSPPQIIIVGTHVPTSYYLRALRPGASMISFFQLKIASMVLAWFLTFGVVRESPQQYASTSTLRALRPAEYCWFPVVLVFRHGSEKFASTPKPWRRPAGRRTASWRPASRRPASQRPAGRRLAGQWGSAGQRGSCYCLVLGRFHTPKECLPQDPRRLLDHDSAGTAAQWCPLPKRSLSILLRG